MPEVDTVRPGSGAWRHRGTPQSAAGHTSRRAARTTLAAATSVLALLAILAGAAVSSAFAPLLRAEAVRQAALTHTPSPRATQPSARPVTPGRAGRAGRAPEAAASRSMPLVRVTSAAVATAVAVTTTGAVSAAASDRSAGYDGAPPLSGSPGVLAPGSWTIARTARADAVRAGTGAAQLGRAPPVSPSHV